MALPVLATPRRGWRLSAGRDDELHDVRRPAAQVLVAGDVDGAGEAVGSSAVPVDGEGLEAIEELMSVLSGGVDLREEDVEGGSTLDADLAEE